MSQIILLKRHCRIVFSAIDPLVNPSGYSRSARWILLLLSALCYTPAQAGIVKDSAFNAAEKLLPSPININTPLAGVRAATKGPGGVTQGLGAWYRGDQGLTSAQWNDFSGNGIHIPQPVANRRPGINTSSSNFNPAATFNGGQYFGKGYVVDAASSVFGNMQPLRVAIFAVAVPTEMATGGVFYQHVNSGQMSGIEATPTWSSGTAIFDAPYPTRVSAAWGGVLGKPNVWSFTKTTTNMSILRDRNTLVSTNGNFTFTGTAGNYAANIGLWDNNHPSFYKGSIPEVIVYKDIAALSSTDQQKIESYLALKYGVTLNQTTPTDYLASDGSNMWVGDPVFKYRITGIGRDDLSSLEQKQSRSVDEGFISLALGTQIVSSNNANTNSIINDLSFLVFADNGMTVDNFSVTATSPINPAISTRMPRIWKLQKKNWADQQITLQANFTGLSKYLLISNTPAFSVASITKVIPFTGNTITLNSSDLPADVYFTIGVAAKGPGGVNQGIAAWYRGDQGLSKAQWNDFSGLDINIPQPVAALQPVINQGAANFNPAPVFNGTQFFGKGQVVDPASSVLGNMQVQQLGVFSAAIPNVLGSNTLFSQETAVANNRILVHVPWTDGTLYFDPPNSLRASAAWGGTLKKTNVWSFTKTTTNISVFRDRNTVINKAGSFTSNISAGNYAFNIGAIAAGAGFFNGNIPELIVYKDITALTATDQQKIESYLALKYGVTLNQTTPTDYLASDGTKMWTGDAVYKYCITGIGRDDQSALIQKQSLSVDAGLITLALGTQVTTTNAANAANITNDLSFLTFADNGLVAASYDVPAATPINAAVTKRMARVWKVNKTGWADQQITLQANINGSTKYLLISNTDQTFSSANITKVVVFTGNAVTINSSDLPNNAFFTFASSITGPGGITNKLDLWLKANDGVLSGDGTKVPIWKNATDNNYHVSTTSVADQPVFYNKTVSQLVNFNPSVVYKGTENSTAVLRNPARLFPNTSAFQFIGVGMDRRTNWAAGTSGGLLSSGVLGNHPVLYLLKGGGSNGWAAFMGGGTTSFFTTSNAIIYNGGSTGYNNIQPQIFSMGSLNNGATATASNIACWVDGFKENTSLSAFGQPEIGNGVFVGSSDDNSTWIGHVPEVMIFERQLTDPEMAKVNSYLAIKYGVTMDQRTPRDYVATDGTVIWNATGNATHKYNIGGIGRDDVENLQQRQSRSVNGGLQLAIGLGNLFITNVDNTHNFANDKAYLLWGDDNGTLNYRTTVANHPIVNFRMARTWKVQQTAAMTGQVEVAIPFDAIPNTKEAYLIISNDNTFDGTDQFIKLSEMMLQGVKHFAAKTSFTNGQFFTFGAYIKAPGGVPGTSLWLRPDYGTSSTSDGTRINTWTDYAADLNNALQPTAGAQPAYVNNLTNNLNFNPQVLFNGNQWMSLNASKLPTGTTPRTLFGVGNPVNNTGNKYIISWGVSSNAMGQGLASIAGAGYYVGVNDDVKNPGFWKPGVPDVLVGTWAGASGGNIAATYSKTKALVSEAKTNWNTATSAASIGSYLNASETWNGTMGDVIVYPYVLNATELRRVETYLAVKYGYTLDQTTPGNYLATDGSIIWNATNNGVYKNNIAGIGFDNLEGLEQKQSRSIHTGAILAIGLQVVATDNLSNTGTFDNDKSYMLWGSNSNSLATISTNLPAGSCVRQRLSQQWKVQYTNFDPTAKQLALDFDLNGITYAGADSRDFTLLIDNDGDGDFTTGTITEIKAAGYNATSKKVNFTGVSKIPAGAVFTLTTSQPVRIATLVPDGQAKTTTSICKEDNWIYFIHPDDGTKYIAAIDLNGNTVNVTDFSATIADVSKSMASLGTSSNNDYGTQLMRRLLQITYTGAPLTVNGGVKLRFMWDPAEQTAAETYLSGTRNVAAPQRWAWFRHTGDIAITLSDLSPEGLNNVITILPTSTGNVDGVDFIEFEGIQEFDVLGGMVTANEVVSVRKVQDGAEGGQNGQFILELPDNVVAPEDMVIQYTISGTAVNGTDYGTLSGQVTLQAGNSQVTLPVIVTDDNVIEQTESVTIQITTATGASTGNLYGISNTLKNATVNITDNDLGKALLSITKIADAAEPSTNGSYSISLPVNVTSSEDITVNYSIAGSADNGDDYTTLSGIVVIPHGVTSISLPVKVMDDKIIEGSEEILLTLTGGTSTNFIYTANPAASSATMTIADDDNTTANQVISITRTANAAEPATNGSFVVSLPAGYTTAKPITVNYTVSGNATADKDFVTLTGTIVIPAGENSVPLDVTVKDDKIIEGNETVVVTITGGNAPVLGVFEPDNTNFSANVIIADDDDIALNKILSIIKNTDAAEPAINGSYRISLPAGITVAEAVTVNYIMSGTAANGIDYAQLNGTIILPAGDNSIPLGVNVTDDKIIEGDETAIATLVSGSSAAFTFVVDAVTPVATITIADDDNMVANKVLHLSKTTDASEPATNGAFEIGMPSGYTSVSDISVSYTITGSAANGTDYKTLTGTITIPAGQNAVPLLVEVTDDKIIEGNETVIATLNSGNATSLGAFTLDAVAKTATVTIADDDNSTANLVLNISKVTDAAEPSTDGAFSIGLPSGYTASENITINYAVTGTGTNGTDYQMVSQIILPAGSNAVPLPVAVEDDKIIEGDETVIVTISNGTSTSFTLATGTNKTATVTIADNDNTTTNKVVSAVKVSDGAEPATNGSFRLQLPNGVTAVLPVSVQYTVGGTAIGGTDYEMLNGTAIIPAGQNGVDVTVKVIDDSIIEDDETLMITATGGNSATFGAFTGDVTPATVIIKDDDNVDGNKVISIVKTLDAAEPGTNGGFTISLPAGITLPQPVTVSYTVGGTAINGIDYQNLSGTVVIPAGQNSVPLPVIVKDDKIIEINETVIVNISGGTAVNYGVFQASSTKGSATVTIADDDNTPVNTQLTITKVADAGEPATNGNYSITLPNGITSSEDITVKYNISGTAIPGSDYTALSGTVVIPAGQPGVSLPVNVMDDKIIETAETVVTTLAGGTSTNFTFSGTGNATVTIADDDNIATNMVFSIQKLSGAAEPNVNGVFRIALPSGIRAAESIIINYTVTGTATEDVDYTKLSGTIVLTAGNNSILLPALVIDDLLIEGDETVIVTLTNGTTASLGNFTASTTNGNATITIADDDDITVNKILRITKTADAAEPATNGAFTISLPTGIKVAEPVTVNYTISGSAVNGTDYDNLNGSIVIPAGQNSVTIPLTVKDDKIVEGTENVVLTLTDGTSAKFTFNADAVAGSAAANITDDDNNAGNGLLSIVKTTDAAEPATNGVFTISLPAGMTYAQDIIVNYTISGAATSSTDFTALTGSALIKAGFNSTTLTVPVIDDKIIEGIETVIATITGGTATGFAPLTASTTNGAATLSIIDDDNITANKVVSIVKTTDAAEPSTNGAFRISLPAGVTAVEDVTVNYTITGAATNGSDYVILSGITKIPAGNNSTLLNVTVQDDKIIENSETVIVTLGAINSATFGAFGVNTTQGTAIVTITDNDNTTANKVLSAVKRADAAEPSTNGGFSISLPTDITSSEPVTISYAISGIAFNGIDYTNLSGTIILAAGQNSVLLPVTVIDDKIIEGTETVALKISDGSSTSFGFIAGGVPASLDILDDDNTNTNKTLRIVKVADASEPAANGSFRVSLPSGITAAGPIKVSYIIDVAGTASADVDYTAITGDIEIPAGSNSVMIPIDVIDDQIIEPVEKMVMNINGGTSGTFTYGVDAAAATATVFIADDDFTLNSNVVLVTKVSDAIEGSTQGMFKISLPPGVTAAEPVTIHFSMGGAAINTIDYTTLNGIALIQPGNNFVLVNVDAFDDGIMEGPEEAIMSLTGASSDTYTFNIMPGKGSATVTIIDANAANDIPVTVTRVTDAAEPGTNGRFQVALVGGVSTYPVTVGYKLSGTAESGVDYTISGTVIIPANTPSVDVNVTVIDDKIIEGPEEVVFTVISGSATDGAGNAFIFPADAVDAATVTITDDDNNATNMVLATAKEADAAEPSGNGSFRISLPAGYTASTDIAVQYSITGSADVNDDYTISATATIPQGRNFVIVPVNVINDKIIEVTEDIIQTLTSGTDGLNYSYTVPGAAATAKVLLTDDDGTSANRLLTITRVADGSEPATNGRFQISLPDNITAAEAITINYTVAGTAVNGTDYETLTNSIVLPANQNSVFLDVKVEDDKIIEGEETVQVTLAGGTSANFTFAGTNNASLVIADDDNTAAARVLQVQQTIHAAEPNVNGNFRVFLPTGYSAARDITLEYTLTGSATREEDYTVSVVTLPALANSVDIPVSVIDDKIIEPTETVIMNIVEGNDNNGNPYTVDPIAKTATVNIADDDNTGTNKTLTVTKLADASEPNTRGVFSISLPAGITADEDVVINYTITGNAANGIDYQQLTGTLTLPAHSNSVKVDVIPKDDKIIEGNEAVTMTLTNGNTATLGAFVSTAPGNTATMVIADDDNTTANQVLQVIRKANASEPATNGGFEIRLPAGITAAQDITVNYTITGTAANGTDYQVLTGTVVLLHDQNNVPIPVMVLDDKIIEQPETVVLNITDGTSASFSYAADAVANSATITIADNDDIAGNKVLSVVKTTDAAEPATNGAFTISLPVGVTAVGDVTVNYTITGTAENGTDYTITSSAVIPAGENNINVPVLMIDDKMIEGNETVMLTLKDGKSALFSNFTISTTNGAATVTIADDDDITINKLLSIKKTTDAAEPGTNGTFMISLPNGITAVEDITVQYDIAGTGVNGTDYETLSGSIVIPAGQPGVELPVLVKDDKIIEGNETVIINLTGGKSAKFVFAPTGLAIATLTILDDENVTVNRVVSVTKGGDAVEPVVNGVFVFSLPAGLTAAAPVTVNYTIGGTATAGTDYKTLTGTIVIPAGQPSATVTVEVIDDLIMEETEVVTATITDGTATGLGTFTASNSNGNAVVRIADNDNRAANKVLSVVKTTDAAEQGTNGVFTISLPGGMRLTDDLAVNYTITGTATNGVDYTIAASATIPAGQSTVTVPVTVIDDKIVEGEETVILTLKDGKSNIFGDFTGSNTAAAATVTIGDDDDIAANRMLSVTKAGDAAEPGTNGSFLISLPAGITASEVITVNYTITGTAANGTDYTISSTATINAGEENVTVPVTTTDDKIIEGDENIILALTGGTTTGIGNFTVKSTNATATMTIADDDNVAANLVLNITATQPIAAEPSTNGEVRIALPANVTATVPITVQYTVAGSAAGGTDYKALTGTVIIPAGNNSVTVSVEVIDNQIQEGARNVVFTLTGGTGGSWAFVPGMNKTATVTINDDDVQRFDTWKTVVLPAENTSGVAHPNETLTYTIHVRNTGNVQIAQVAITDPVPANTSYVSGGSLNGNVVNFTINNLAPGATASVDLLVKTPASLDGVTSITNTAQVTDGKETKATGGCDPTAPGCSSQPGTVIAASNVSGDLVITKTVLDPAIGTYRMGQDITYSIKVKSTGNTVYTNVLVEDMLPPNLEIPKSVNVPAGQVTKDATTGKVTWTISSLPAGEEMELRMVCRIVEGGNIVNSATVTAKEPEIDKANNTAVATIKAEGGDLTFQNVFTPNGDGKNERFIIGGLEKYPGSAIYIYNRWGGMVYQSKDYRNNWDGSQLNEATYYYILEVRKPQGITRYKGWVQILR